MYSCIHCGSVYLRKEDAEKCVDQEVETPLIEVGKLLIDHSYDRETVIRCFSIKKAGHEISYQFEWLEPEGNEWKYVFTVNSNRCLKDHFSEQI
ncbi:hypothetical protein QNH46_14780 [Paenibacillus woosongensis]|uniref:Uncharacterized protein n=1 Tax=Paenibacillus woosongensis TaxID=307580 RepID=A0AA95I3V0_9BACL|nr:hypothetical protein [Paenibacillus woosongensis]WHX47422.1 hypothetical protein QNH46_14780 [Paenibacillus woosongensis]